MCIQIGGKHHNRAYASYRGAERLGPSEPGSVSGSDELSKLYNWYLRNSMPCIEASELGTARRLVDIYSRAFPDEPLEIFEFVDPGSAPVAGTDLLGYDLTTGHHSLLPWALDARLNVENPPESFAGQEVGTMIRRIQEYFSARLNEYWLFRDPEDAEFCLSLLRPINGLIGPPWLYETPDTLAVFRVYAIWSIYQPDDLK